MKLLRLRNLSEVNVNSSITLTPKKPQEPIV